MVDWGGGVGNGASEATENAVLAGAACLNGSVAITATATAAATPSWQVSTTVGRWVQQRASGRQCVARQSSNKQLGTNRHKKAVTRSSLSHTRDLTSSATEGVSGHSCGRRQCGAHIVGKWARQWASGQQ